MTRRGPRPVNERLRRLLVMLPWLMERGSVSTSDMAKHFGLEVDELVADLTLVSLCGVSQDPRDLIDVWVDEDHVHFGLPKYFERPLRLTVPEAFSLVAAAIAAEQMTGADRRGHLASAIGKVAKAVGFDPERDLSVELETPEELGTLARACADRRMVEFDYWSVETGEATRRCMAPVEVFGDGGHWYLRAFDLEADREKTFRVDRIDAVEITDTPHEVTLGPRQSWFSSSDEVRRVRLRVDPAASWIVEQYPSVRREPSEDGLEITLLANGERWLSRLLLRLGPRARVIEPQEWVALGARTAERVLERYRRTN